MGQFIQRSAWSVADRIAAIITIIGCLFLFLHQELGRLEGSAWPVAHLSEVSWTADGAATSVVGKVVVLRPSCTFERLDWFLVGESREAQIPVVFSEGTVVRPEGASSFGPWILSIPPELFKSTRAAVYHTCPWRPWPVVTHLYP